MSTPANNLECKICIRVYSPTNPQLTPRILGCGHTICQQCASNIFRDTTIICPFDRVPTSNLTEAASLPKNFVLMEILEEDLKKKKKEDCEEKEVAPKKKKNLCAEDEKHDADWYCGQCDAMFCEICFTKVHSSKFNATHEKLPITQRPYQLPKCPKHPSNFAEFLCTKKKCSLTPKLFCHACFITTHKNHSFEELTKKIDKAKELLRECLNSNCKVRWLVEKDEQRMSALKQGYAVESDEYKKVAEDIDKYFEARKERALGALEAFAEERTRKIASYEYWLQCDMARVDGWNEKLNEAIGTTSDFDFEEMEELLLEMKKNEKSSWKSANIEVEDGYPKFGHFCK